jgi:hypothetical protein
MTIRELSDRIMLKGNDKLGDPKPYAAWKALHNRIMPEEFDPEFNSVFWNSISQEFNLISATFFARTLIALGEKNVRMKAKKNLEIAERIENDDRVDDLVWEEIKQILSFE